MRRKKKKLTPQQQRRRLIAALAIISTMFVITLINIDKDKNPKPLEKNIEELLMDESLDSLLQDAGFDNVSWIQKDTLEKLEVLKENGTKDTLSVRKVHFGDIHGKTHVTFQSIRPDGRQRLHYTGPAYRNPMPPAFKNNL